jgi:hypothetical protein
MFGIIDCSGRFDRRRVIYSLLFFDNPLPQKCRTIPKFDTCALANRKKIHDIAINERHFCKIKGDRIGFAQDQVFDGIQVFPLDPPTHAQHHYVLAGGETFDLPGHWYRSLNYWQLRLPIPMSTMQRHYGAN